MSQLAQLSEAEIEDRFYVVGQRPVQFMLAGFAEHGETFTVQFNHGQEHFLSILLAAPLESGKLIFDCSGSPETNRRFLQSDEVTFIGRPGGVLVQFTTSPAVESLHAGARAFSVPLPKKILRLQRREFFRIETPRARPPQFFGRLTAGGSLINAMPHDISCSGLGLTLTSLPADLVPGAVLAKTRIVLPEDTLDIFVDATVRHITEQTARAGTPQWRLGVEFRDIGHAAENRIQRYIARVEHERHELA